MIMSSNSGGAGMIVGSNGGNLKKGPWSASEDAVLIDYVRKHGEGNWNAVQRNTGLLRCGKSCRLRWANHLRPNLKKGAFSSDEERLIIDLHSKLGNKWARISAHLPGRTDNEIKNYWNTRVKRRIRQGLPLYPNDHSLPPPPPPLHPPLLPLSLPKTPPPPPPAPILSLFNPVSLPSPLFSLHHHHHPPPFFSQNYHPLKRCTQNSFMGGPTFSPSQMGSFRIGFGPDPGDKIGLDGFGFGCTSFNELPSNQYNQNVDSNSNFMEDEIKVNVNANAGRVNSGLLDDLLQEAQVKVGLKREREEDYCSLQWDVPSSENSYTGIKDQSEENELNLDSQEIPNIIELIPSLVQVPTWYTDGGAQSSAAQSSAVSTDDNCNVIDDRMPQPPSFAAENTTDYDADGDWNPTGCYSWDNLPRIC